MAGRKRVASPAAACGVVGLKPEWGQISASGVVPLSRQLDHVGPLAASVGDAWLLYNAMLPESDRISTRPEAMSLKGLRLGRFSGYLSDRLDADVERGVSATIDRMQQRGAKVVDVTLPHANDMAAIYLHLVFGDAAEYHARTLVSRPQDYTTPVRLRLEMARYVLAEDYIRALRGKALIANEVDRALDGVDALVLPSLAIPAPPVLLRMSSGRRRPIRYPIPMPMARLIIASIQLGAAVVVVVLVLSDESGPDCVVVPE